MRAVKRVVTRLVLLLFLGLGLLWPVVFDGVPSGAGTATNSQSPIGTFAARSSWAARYSATARSLRRSACSRLVLWEAACC